MAGGSTQKTFEKGGGMAAPRFRAQAGKGRPKGVPNKATAQVKEMVIAALSKAGGVDYLARQAKETPSAFLSLVGKVIPVQVGGVDGAPITHVVEIVGVSA